MPIQALTQTFKQAADPANGLKQAAYLKDHFVFWGIPKPKRHLLEIEVFKNIPLLEEEALKAVVRELWGKNQREFHYSALTLVKRHQKKHSPQMLDLFEALIRANSWWDTVDDLAANHVGVLVKKYPHLQEKLDKWVTDPHMWVRRTSLLYQLSFKEQTDEKRLFHACLTLAPEKEFFIRKAIGWALRQYSKSCPQAARAFLKEHREALSPLSLKEASKYL